MTRLGTVDSVSATSGTGDAVPSFATATRSETQDDMMTWDEHVSELTAVVEQYRAVLEEKGQRFEHALRRVVHRCSFDAMRTGPPLRRQSRQPRPLSGSDASSTIGSSSETEMTATATSALTAAASSSTNDEGAAAKSPATQVLPETKSGRAPLPPNALKSGQLDRPTITGRYRGGGAPTMESRTNRPTSDPDRSSRSDATVPDSSVSSKVSRVRRGDSPSRVSPGVVAVSPPTPPPLPSVAHPLSSEGTSAEGPAIRIAIVAAPPTRPGSDTDVVAPSHRAALARPLNSATEHAPVPAEATQTLSYRSSAASGVSRPSSLASGSRYSSAYSSMGGTDSGFVSPRGFGALPSASSVAAVATPDAAAEAQLQLERQAISTKQGTITRLMKDAMLLGLGSRDMQEAMKGTRTAAEIIERRASFLSGHDSDQTLFSAPLSRNPSNLAAATAGATGSDSLMPSNSASFAAGALTSSPSLGMPPRTPRSRPHLTLGTPSNTAMGTGGVRGKRSPSNLSSAFGAASPSSAGASPSYGAGGGAGNASLVSEAQLTNPRAREKYWSSVMRENEALRLKEVIADGEAMLAALLAVPTAGRPAETAAAEELRDAIGELSDRAADMAREREVFAATLASLYAVATRERGELETALTLATRRAEQAEDQALLAMHGYLRKVQERALQASTRRNRHSSSAVAVHAAGGDSGDDWSDAGDGSNSMHSRGVQCMLEADTITESAMFLSNLAKMETLLSKVVRDVESHITALDVSDARFEDSLRCQRCGLIPLEMLALWPCGHTFCSDCVYRMVLPSGDSQCSLCNTVTGDVPVPNLAVNGVLCRVVFKRSGYRSLISAVATLRDEVVQLDEAFLRSCLPQYRVLPESDEFVTTHTEVRARIAA